jgi:hypothetical protein
MGGERLDTRNPTSKLMLTILAGVATWEREIKTPSAKCGPTAWDRPKSPRLGLPRHERAGWSDFPGWKFRPKADALGNDHETRRVLLRLGGCKRRAPRRRRRSERRKLQERSLMLRTLSVIVVISITAPAMAQNPHPTSPTNPTLPLAPSNAPSPPPERIAPAEGDLSHRLARENGTIIPPKVDPGMTVSPPPRAGASMPVIPPPGSPGGNPSVVPK